MTHLYFKDGTVLDFPDVDTWTADWEEPATLDLKIDEAMAGCFYMEDLLGWYTESE